MRIMENDYDEDPRRERDDSFEDERDREPARPARRKSSNRALWILLILGGIGLMLLCGGGLIALVAWGVKGVMEDLPAATATSNEFFDALQQDKIDDAYALTNEKFRKEQ